MEAKNEDFVEVMETMTNSISAARAALQSVKQKLASTSVPLTRDRWSLMCSQQNLDVTNGISLLSLKHHMLLSYLQSLVLVSAQRVLGKTLTERAPPESFGSKERNARGSNPGDLIDSMIENRIVLEKVEVLESKMRYQIEKLVRIADEPAQDTKVIEGQSFFTCSVVRPV